MQHTLVPITALVLAAALPAQREPNHVIQNNGGIFAASGGFGDYGKVVPEFDGDGWDDIATAAPSADEPLNSGGPQVGTVYVHSGRRGTLIRKFFGTQVGSNFGRGIDSPGDYDAAVWSVGILLGGMVPLTPFRAALPGNHLAPQLALVRTAAGGYALAIGTPTADTNGLVNNGTVEFYAGGSSPAWTQNGTATSDNAGIAVVATRDVDGDGEEEVLCVAGTTTSGRAVIVRQDGSIAETTPLSCQGTVRPISIEDVTGDGRGEWGHAWLTGVCGRSETLIFSRGLDQVIDMPMGPAGSYVASFDIDLGPANAGKSYWQLYSVSGTSPGYLGPPPWPLVPLNLDDTTAVMENLAGTAFTPDSIGVLDAAGRATTNLLVPALLVQFFVVTQTEVVTVAAALDTPLNVPATSNPMRIPIR